MGTALGPGLAHRGLGLRPEPPLEDTKSSKSGLRLSVVTVGRKEQ